LQARKPYARCVKKFGASGTQKANPLPANHHFTDGALQTTP
jgi:hypothetical protein